MNRNLPLFTWLFALLFGLSSLLNGFFIFQQIMVDDVVRDINLKISERAARDFQIQTIAQSLLNDLGEYGKKQPAIYSVLNKYGVNFPPPQPPPPNLPLK